MPLWVSLERDLYNALSTLFTTTLLWVQGREYLVPGDYKHCEKCSKKRPLGSELLCKACRALLGLEQGWDERRERQRLMKERNTEKSREWQKREKLGQNAKRNLIIEARGARPTLVTSPCFSTGF